MCNLLIERRAEVRQHTPDGKLAAVESAIEAGNSRVVEMLRDRLSRAAALAQQELLQEELLQEERRYEQTERSTLSIGSGGGARRPHGGKRGATKSSKAGKR